MNDISPNLVWQHSLVTRARREVQNGHKSAVLWFTGLSGAGKARQGLIKDFTGISLPYEPPKRPELAVDAAALTLDECVTQVIQHLYASGKLSAVQG